LFEFDIIQFFLQIIQGKKVSMAGNDGSGVFFGHYDFSQIQPFNIFKYNKKERNWKNILNDKYTD